MRMNLWLHKCMGNTIEQCPWKSEEGIKSPVTEVTDVCVEPWEYMGLN